MKLNPSDFLLLENMNLHGHQLCGSGMPSGFAEHRRHAGRDMRSHISALPSLEAKFL
jgi:hypothetical protein